MICLNNVRFICLLKLNKNCLEILLLNVDGFGLVKTIEEELINCLFDYFS